MTDASTPDDEIISSHLDGEANPSEAERVESDANWMQRRSELKAASALPSQPVTPLDPEVVDQLISVAIEAGGVPSNVTDLSAARRSRLPQILTAAAAIVLLALAVPIVRSIGDSSGDSNSAATSFAAAATTTAAAGVAQDQAESALAPKSVSPTSAAASSLDAGSATPADMADSVSSPTVFGLPPVDSAMFDPLPSQLPDLADLAALRSQLATRFADAPTSPSDSRTSAAQLEVVPQPEISPQCADLLGEFASNNTILSSAPTPESFTDFALVSVDGTTDLIALIQLEPGRAVALVVDATECLSVTSIDVAP